MNAYNEYIDRVESIDKKYNRNKLEESKNIKKEKI
jgi:hypothetical protein